MKLLNYLVYQIKEIVDEKFGIMDETGAIIASSDGKKTVEQGINIEYVIKAKEHFIVYEGWCYQKISIKNKVDFIAYIEYRGEESLKYLSLIAVSIANLKTYHDEKYDKLNLIKNIMLKNIMPGEEVLKSKDLHIPYNAYRVVLLIKTEKSRDVYAHDVIQGLFPNKNKDFVIIIDEENTVLVKELKALNDIDEIKKTAKTIVDTVNSELMVRVNIGIGTAVDKLKDLGKSYQEAQVAINIGSIFENDSTISNFSSLGIGRLVYQIPKITCDLFLKEVFKDGSLESFDSETLNTVQKFFENNLNVSETSRQLFIHRNTLVYRLEKIQKVTGLDLRNFDDAIIFKVATLVKRYLGKDSHDKDNKVR